MYSAVASMTKGRAKDTPDIGMLRHITLNMIRSVRVKFKREYGQLVIASDSYKYWRRDLFPYYKAGRKRRRDESGLDWTSIFNHMNQIKSELKEFMPYKYIEVESAEADDIIASLVQTYHDEPILIASGDGDFVQLHKFKNVRQYDIVRKRFVKTDDPMAALREHIIRGDFNDGIPNVLSPDNVLALRIRQKKITQKVLSDLATIEFEPDHKYYRNYMRNKNLIDLERIPEGLKEQIILCYENSNPSRAQVLNYFMANRLKQHIEALNEF